MRKLPVYQILAQDLKDLGVDTVFGLMSDDICQLFATLDAMGVRVNSLPLTSEKVWRALKEKREREAAEQAKEK